MKDFILENWRELLSAIAVIASIILLIIRKKPVINEMDNILLAVFEVLPDFIIQVETFKGADTKKALVLESVKNFVKNKFSVNLPDSYLTVISAAIEDILSTPQKHN